MFVLSSKLSEDGWLDELKDYSKEKARGTENLAFQPLLDNVLAFTQSEYQGFLVELRRRLMLARGCSCTDRERD